LGRVAKVPSCQRRLATTSADDLVGDAVEAVLLGEAQPGQGRRLTARNRRSTTAFILYLQSVINSQLSNLTRSLEANCEHVPVGNHWENPEAVEPVDLVDLLDLIERRDLKAVLFARLRQWAFGHVELTRIIDAWEQHFDGSDRIGNGTFDPNLVRRVRLKSREICLELTHEFNPQATTGREIL
jgi:hypothetical protein